MLLPTTITHNPAPDIAYLLHKDPGKPHEASLEAIPLRPAAKFPDSYFAAAPRRSCNDYRFEWTRAEFQGRAGAFVRHG